MCVKVASVFINESHGAASGSRNGPQTAPDNTRAKCALVIIIRGQDRTCRSNLPIEQGLEAVM